MTPYQAKFVAHIINLARYDKTYATWSIAEFQRIDPFQLGELRALVLAEVARLKSEPQTLVKPA